MKNEFKIDYNKEHLLTEDINIYRNMLRKHRVGTEEYSQIANHIAKLKNLKKQNREVIPPYSPYFKRGLPILHGASKKSKNQQILEELYKERKDKQIQIFNLEIEVKNIDKRIKEVKTSKKKVMVLQEQGSI